MIILSCRRLKAEAGRKVLVSDSEARCRPRIGKENPVGDGRYCAQAYCPLVSLSSSEPPGALAHLSRHRHHIDLVASAMPLPPTRARDLLGDRYRMAWFMPLPPCRLPPITQIFWLRTPQRPRPSPLTPRVSFHLEFRLANSTCNEDAQ